MDARFAIDADFRILAAPAIVAGLAMVAVLFALSRVAALLSSLAFLALSLVVAAGCTLRLVDWQRRGIRHVELDEEGLTTWAGAGLRMRRVERRAVREVRVASFAGRRTIVLGLSTGQRVKIAGDAFPERAFEELATLLRPWRGARRP